MLVFAAFGLKLLVVDLASSRAVEIPSPKFHQRSSVPRTVSFRPPLLSSDDGSSHMALLTRTNGKDLISIHAPHGRQLQRSWVPDTIDAQALAWSPDGQLLLISESPAHGWRLLLYTPDGQLVRSLDATSISDDPDAALRTGIRAFYTSPSTLCYAVSEYSRAVSVLDAATWRRTLGLAHPVTICPSDTLQVPHAPNMSMSP